MLEIRHEAMDTTAATQQAYNEVYAGEGILLRDSFYLWLIQLLKPQPGKSLLDISCGYGRLVTLARRQGLQASGVDFAGEAVLRGKKASPQSGWGIADGEQLPLATASVDYITHIGSLEHYQQPGCGAREIARILKPDGRACILLPNAYGLFGNIRFVMSHGEIFDDGQPLQRYATRRTWEKLLQAGGLRIDKVVGYGEVEFPRTLKDAGWVLTRPIKLVRFVLAALTPLNLVNHFVFICSPDPSFIEKTG
jgi:SAM-dependent methyltransferase